ncbi:unnamed protein product, partial [Iphiclides podalirius]
MPCRLYQALNFGTPVKFISGLSLAHNSVDVTQSDEYFRNVHVLFSIPFPSASSLRYWNTIKPTSNKERGSGIERARGRGERASVVRPRGINSRMRRSARAASRQIGRRQWPIDARHNDRHHDVFATNANITEA